MAGYYYHGGQPYAGFGNSQRPPYNPNYNRYSNNNVRSYQGAQQPPRKRSGAKFQMREGAPLISGWRKNKYGFQVLYARPYGKTKKTESKNGKEWMNLFVTITNQSTGQVTKTSGMYDVQQKKLYIKELNLVATTRGRGGYFGRHLGGINNGY